MNWTAGILAFVLVYVPIAVIFYRLHKSNQAIDRQYKQAIADIKKRYKVDL